MRNGPRRTALFPFAAALGLLSVAGAAPAGPPPQGQSAYEARLAVYRSGDFAAALRPAMALSMDRLRDEAEEFRDGIPFRHNRFDLDVLAAAMLHFDLAWAAEMEPEKNEDLARSLLAQATPERSREWLRDSHLGLLGVYVEQGRLDDAARAARLLAEEYPDHPPTRLALARLAEVIGWGTHDERFFDQAQDRYEELALAGEGDAAELRLRVAHLTLREGNPEAALQRLDEAGNALGARHRFVSLLLRGETLLWLDRAAAADEAFTEAHAVHLGSLSAAAGLAAARLTRGDGRRAADAARAFLSENRGQDTWWHFLVQPLADEKGRLDALRGAVLLPGAAPNRP